MAATGVVLPAVARRPGTAREHDLGRVRHPDHLVVAGRNLTLVDDPLVAPLAAGYPPLGWEGDPRLALYIDRLRGEWVLVRFEAEASSSPSSSPTTRAGASTWRPPSTPTTPAPRPPPRPPWSTR